MTAEEFNYLHPASFWGRSTADVGSFKFLDIKNLSIEARQGLKVSSKSFYRDNKWDFTAELPDYPSYEVILDFSKIRFSDGSNIVDLENKMFLDQVREFYFTLLVDPPSSYPKLTTWVTSTRRCINSLFDYMKTNSILYLCDLDEGDLADFLDRISGQEKPQGGIITNRTLATRSQGLDWLFEQGTKMSTGLIVNPFVDYGSRTQWAKFAAQKVLPRNKSRTVEIPDAVVEKIVVHALEDLKIGKVLSDIYEVEQRFPLPGYGTKTRSRAMKEVYEIYGWWNDDIKGHIRKTLESRLEGAAYCLIALFTGMRIHEILRMKYGLENNWVEEFVEIDGGIKKMFFVISTTTKLEARPTSYKWQTIPVVQEAILALEQGLKRYFDAGNIWLFASRGKGSLKRKQATVKSAVGHSIKNLCKAHNITHNEIVWDLSSHQFRKKFARIMVRQGLGLKALQDQLKHYDIEMTKIYGDANLYVELQAEKFELSAELIEEFVGKQIPVIGGGAEELDGLRKEFLGLTRKDRSLFLRSLPTKAVVEQTDDGLCFYRPNKALCGGDKANCRPGDCNNAWMPAAGKKRTLLWRKKENERMMTFFKAQPLKVEFLRTRNVEIEKLLGQLENLEN
tara:strand:- start:36901 stop:38763 length:1863 start_codon:yes stop_codon:yes gene_type:complete